MELSQIVIHTSSLIEDSSYKFPPRCQYIESRAWSASYCPLTTHLDIYHNVEVWVCWCGDKPVLLLSTSFPLLGLLINKMKRKRERRVCACVCVHACMYVLRSCAWRCIILARLKGCYDVTGSNTFTLTEGERARDVAYPGQSVTGLTHRDIQPFILTVTWPV